MDGHDSDYDDAERLRIRQADADAQATRVPPPPGRGAAVRVGSVLSTTVTSGQKVYKLQAYLVTGAETEGTTGTLTDAGYFFYATNLNGSTVTAAATKVLCVRVKHRWVFRAP